MYILCYALYNHVSILEGRGEWRELVFLPLSKQLLNCLRLFRSIPKVGWVSKIRVRLGFLGIYSI